MGKGFLPDPAGLSRLESLEISIKVQLGLQLQDESNNKMKKQIE